MTTRIHSAVALALAAALFSPAIASAETSWYLSAGAEYTSGKYGGDQSVDEAFVPVTLAVNGARVGFRLTVPWVRVTAPSGTVIAGTDGQPIVASGPRVTESGVGDVTAAFTLFDLVTAADGDFALDLTAKAKLGTADEAVGLGTGENDYTLQLDAFRYLDRATLIGSAGYTRNGDPPGLVLQDAYFAAVGATFEASARTRVGLFYDYRRSSLPGADALQELSGSLSFRLGSGWTVRGYALAGFGDSSPAWGAGLACSAGF